MQKFGRRRRIILHVREAHIRKGHFKIILIPSINLSNIITCSKIRIKYILLFLLFRIKTSMRFLLKDKSVLLLS